MNANYCYIYFYHNIKYHIKHKANILYHTFSILYFPWKLIHLLYIYIYIHNRISLLSFPFTMVLYIYNSLYKWYFKITIRNYNILLLYTL